MERQTAVLLEKEKERVSERFFLTMDSNTRAELSDNAWLKKEVRYSDTYSKFVLKCKHSSLIDRYNSGDSGPVST